MPVHHFISVTLHWNTSYQHSAQLWWITRHKSHLHHHNIHISSYLNISQEHLTRLWWLIFYWRREPHHLLNILSHFNTSQKHPAQIRWMLYHEWYELYHFTDISSYVNTPHHYPPQVWWIICEERYQPNYTFIISSHPNMSYHNSGRLWFVSCGKAMNSITSCTSHLSWIFLKMVQVNYDRWSVEKDTKSIVSWTFRLIPHSPGAVKSTITVDLPPKAWPPPPLKHLILFRYFLPLFSSTTTSELAEQVWTWSHPQNYVSSGQLWPAPSSTVLAAVLQKASTQSDHRNRISPQ